MPNNNQTDKKKEENVLAVPTTDAGYAGVVIPSGGVVTSGGGGTGTGPANTTSSSITTPGANNNNNTAANGNNNNDGGSSSVSAPKASRPKRQRGKSEKKEAAAPEVLSRFHCNNCRRDLSHQIRARCAVCADYDSCLDCFSVGAALYPHEASHAYRLIEVVHSAVYQQGWSADEEDKLLEGLETYGVGNWDQVAKIIGTKNADDTETHFLSVYMGSKYAPLPDTSKILPAIRRDDKNSGDVDPKLLRVMHKHQMEDAAGWMPKRMDFVYEWDNEAEDILGDMEITPDDTPEDRELKLQVLEIYCRKLDERKRRKDFVIDRGMTDFKAYLALEKKRTKDEREVRDRLKPFSRFLSNAEFERCVDGIMEEKRLRTQIETYKEGRALGATTAAEASRMVKSARSKYSANTNNNITISNNHHDDVLLEPAKKRARTTTSAASNANSKPTTTAAHNIAPDFGPIPTAHQPSVADIRAALLGKEVPPEQQPGAELLGSTEINLIKALKITVHQYVIVKEVLIRESARNGVIKKKDAKAMVRLDQIKVLKIYDYLAASGWIRAPPTSS